MSKHQQHQKHISALQGFAALLILAIAAGILMIFMEHKDMLIATDQMKMFIALATMGCALLLSLLYLVNKPHPSHKAPSTPKQKSSKRK